jgi:hypothetical protein
VSPALIQRPAFSSTMYGITAFEPHRVHLPCSLSVSTRKQSRHSNASDGCLMGLINGSAISTSFQVGDKQLEGFPLVPANPYLFLRPWGLYDLNKPNVNGFTTSANC